MQGRLNPPLLPARPPRPLPTYRAAPTCPARIRRPDLYVCSGPPHARGSALASFLPIKPRTSSQNSALAGQCSFQ